MKLTKRGKFEETKDYQTLCNKIELVCSEFGTLIIDDGVVERDKDIAPFRFYRAHAQVYVFPQQDSKEVKNKRNTIDPSPQYGIYSYSKENSVAGTVEGRVLINYSDSTNSPTLDVALEGNVPETLKKELEELLN